MQGSRDEIGLIACVAAKRPSPAPARDLYTSPLFLKASAYVQARCDRWYILSALHGVICPDKVIEPYDVTLNRMTWSERLDCSKRVLADLQQQVPSPSHFVILAGDRYRAELLAPLRAAGHEMELPMKGLKIGRPLSWLKSALV